MKDEHLPECPKHRHKDSECICDLLRTVRAAARAPKEKRNADRD